METYYSILGVTVYRDDGNYCSILGYVGIMGNAMETTIVYWGFIGIMETKIETTLVYWENGKQNGNHSLLAYASEPFACTP